MAINITDKSTCSGCGACMNICPRHCIQMKSDDCGFSYPIVTKKDCIECGLCENICPLLNHEHNLNHTNYNPVPAYAGWSRNKEQRFHSTSGGIFSELASIVLKEKGVVVGAAYNTHCMVEHVMVSDLEGLKKIRQSKYTQSDTNTIYLQIRELLQENKKVMFCGTPCQVAGLWAFLGKKNYENLYLIDFICRGVNSPKAYRAWLDELEIKVKSKAVRVWFKYKANGWKRSPMCTRIDFENGKHLVQSDYKNSYMYGYLGPNLYIRPSCGACPFKGGQRFSDITLADFWGIAKELDDDGGTSLILLNSPQGQELFEKIKPNIFFQERAFDELLKGNLCFHSSVKINPDSKEFLTTLGELPFSKLVNQYAKVTCYQRLRYLVKHIIKKIRNVHR